jgi:hypothetical protein
MGLFEPNVTDVDGVAPGLMTDGDGLGGWDAPLDSDAWGASRCDVLWSAAKVKAAMLTPTAVKIRIQI